MNAPTSPIPGRIAHVRHALQQYSIAAVIVPSADPHLSECTAERWHGRRWLTGFSGSAGTLVVTPQFAGMWTDSRYWTQGEAELEGTGIELIKTLPGVPNQYVAWLMENLPAGSEVAFAGDVLGVGSARAIKKALSDRQMTLRTDWDVLNTVWKDRPEPPTAPIYEHLMPYAVTTRAKKLCKVRDEMSRLGVDWHFLSKLDDIAWIMNLRGSDIEYNPLFLAHALIGRDRATLFVRKGKVDEEHEEKLRVDGVGLEDYSAAGDALNRLPPTSSVLIDPGYVATTLVDAVPAGVRIIEKINPSTLLKSRKTAQEIAFIRETMEQDGAALCEFFSWFQSAQASGEHITELTIDEQIRAARARRPGFVSPSFGTVAGFNANGAMPHYQATLENHAEIRGNGLLLIDSGGHYVGGTTDITRVLAVGKVSKDQQRDCSLVLKGMIRLARARFPRGTRSTRLDTIARVPLWEACADYRHGTGHGVGYFLNVHEGPHLISAHAISDSHHAMEPGMVTSDEPGIYRLGRWGVRIENLLVAVPAPSSEFGEFLDFETLTLCPIDTRCIDRELLDDSERQWLNDYHSTVRERLHPLVQGGARNWLLSATQPI